MDFLMYFFMTFLLGGAAFNLPMVVFAIIGVVCEGEDKEKFGFYGKTEIIFFAKIFHQCIFFCNFAT